MCDDMRTKMHVLAARLRERGSLSLQEWREVEKFARQLTRDERRKFSETFFIQPCAICSAAGIHTDADVNVDGMWLCEQCANEVRNGG